MKIAYIVDTEKSALGIAAASRAARDPHISIVEGLNFLTPWGLSRYLLEGKFDLIIFSWRFLAYELFSFSYLSRAINNLSKSAIFAFIVPDHLAVEGELEEKEDLLIQAVDYFLVTSEILFKQYRDKYPEKCKGILHDIPNTEALKYQRSQNKVKSDGIIWVGNSKWGERQGFKDHKRYIEIVSVLIAKNYKVRIVDSAIRKLDNSKVLELINENMFLIQCSKSEGTGLPVLEAAALGNIPITTPVGIAGEFLVGDLKNLVVGENVENFERALQWAKNNKSWLPKKLASSFDDYINECIREEIFYKSGTGLHRIRQTLLRELQLTVRWIARSAVYKFGNRC